MARTLEGAYKELKHQTIGDVVAKIGFEVGERVIAYTVSVKNWGTSDAYAMLMRHDNYRADLKEYKFCEVVNEYDAECLNKHNISINTLFDEIAKEFQFSLKYYR